MCRKFDIRCSTCGPKSVAKTTCIVACNNGQFQVLETTNEFGQITQQHLGPYFQPCSEMEDTVKLSHGTRCCYCFDEQENPNTDLERLGYRIRNYLGYIGSPLNDPSALLCLTRLQERFRLTGSEERKEFDRIYLAVESSYFARTEQTWPDVADDIMALRDPLFNILKHLMYYNIVADADDNYGKYLPPLLTELSPSSVTDKDCSVCSEEMGKLSPGDTLENPVKTPCGHIFGNHCISTWLKESENPTCPMCRTLFDDQKYMFPAGYKGGRGNDDEYEARVDEGFVEVPNDWFVQLKNAGDWDRVEKPDEWIQIVG